MKLSSLIAAASLLLAAGGSHAQLPAFPGAEGFGKYATGGRGGDVYHVTSLNDDGKPGTLRHGLDTASGPRTIVFDTGGYIKLRKAIGVTHPNITIAGQTAPGGGIGLTGKKFSLGAKNVIIRHMRMRPGKAGGRSDAFNINKNTNLAIVDHCSYGFSGDENNSMQKPSRLSVQWCFNECGLKIHSAGSLLNANRTSVHHTLWAHNHTRNPKSRDGLLDWVNNIVFDCDIPFILGDADSGTHTANVVNSWFISAKPANRAFVKGRTHRNTGQPTYQLYLQNAWLDGNANGVLDVSARDYDTVSGSVGQRSARFDTTGATVPADDNLRAYKRVLSSGGAWPRDAVDALLVNDVKTFTRRVVEREDDLGLPGGGFGPLEAGQPVADADRDGMSDAWETAMGLDPAAPDNNGDGDGDGYTNLENYLNWLGAPHAQTIPGQSIDIDLRAYTMGFDNDAVYTASECRGGAAEIIGNSTLRFTPAAGFTGLAFAGCAITDGETTASAGIGVLVSPVQ